MSRPESQALGWGDYDDCGYLAPVALHIEQAKLGELLAELAKDYYLTAGG